MLFSKINFLFFEKFQTFPNFFTPAVYPHDDARLGRELGPSRRGAARASRRPARRAC